MEICPFYWSIFEEQLMCSKFLNQESISRKSWWIIDSIYKTQWVASFMKIPKIMRKNCSTKMTGLWILFKKGDGVSCTQAIVGTLQDPVNARNIRWVAGNMFRAFFNLILKIWSISGTFTALTVEWGHRVKYFKNMGSTQYAHYLFRECMKSRKI